MSAMPTPYAALIFLGADAIDAVPFRDEAIRALEDHMEIEPGAKLATDDPNLIAGRSVYVRLSVFDDINLRTGKPAGVRVTFSVASYHPGDTNPDKLHGILANIAARALRHSDADFVEWLAPEGLMERDEFLEVSSYVSKRRGDRHNSARVGASDRQRAMSGLDAGLIDRLDNEVDDKLDQSFEGILKSNQIDGWDPAEMNLARMFRSAATEKELIVVRKEREEQMSTQMRLASWALTGTVATMSMPVAVSMSIVSVAKGEDFRLNTQVLALTGLMGALGASGMLDALPLFGV